MTIGKGYARGQKKEKSSKRIAKLLAYFRAHLEAARGKK